MFWSLLTQLRSENIDRNPSILRRKVISYSEAGIMPIFGERHVTRPV